MRHRVLQLISKNPAVYAQRMGLMEDVLTPFLSSYYVPIAGLQFSNAASDKVEWVYSYNNQTALWEHRAWVFQRLK